MNPLVTARFRKGLDLVHFEHDLDHGFGFIPFFPPTLYQFFLGLAIASRGLSTFRDPFISAVHFQPSRSPQILFE